MSDEDMKRTMEFLIEQNARYSTRLDKDESRLARLENAFVMLVELAGVTDERIDHVGETMATLSNTIDDLVKRMIMLAEAQAHTDAKLAESQARTDAKFAELAESQTRTDAKFAELAESQTRTDAKFADLLDEFKHARTRSSKNSPKRR